MRNSKWQLDKKPLRTLLDERRTTRTARVTLHTSAFSVTSTKTPGKNTQKKSTSIRGEELPKGEADSQKWEEVECISSWITATYNYLILSSFFFSLPPKAGRDLMGPMSKCFCASLTPRCGCVSPLRVRGSDCVKRLSSNGCVFPCRTSV